MRLTIGGLAGETGVNLERIGLMPAPARTAAGHRSYGPEHIHRLSFIPSSGARELEFGIEDTRTLLALAVPGVVSRDEVRELAAIHLASVRAKLTDLVRLEAILADTVARCSGVPAPACPVLDMLDPTRNEVSVDV